MADQEATGSKRNAILTYREIEDFGQNLIRVREDLSAITVKVDQALALKASFDSLDIRVRHLEVNQAVASREGAKSSQVWQTVFHGITTLCALGLSALAIFHH
jgi:hypothetical protein